MPFNHVDPLALIDERIGLALNRRASSPRFSDPYWEADDELEWLRMVRDELARTGHLRAQLRALVQSVPVAVQIAAPSVVELQSTAFEREPSDPRTVENLLEPADAHRMVVQIPRLVGAT